MIPLLVGGRYGFTAGIIASAIAGTAATMSQHFLTEFELRHLLNDNPAYFVALLLTGALAGLANRLSVGRGDHLAERIDELTRERDQLLANNRLYR